jgi:hypothetical protein
VWVSFKGLLTPEACKNATAQAYATASLNSGQVGADGRVVWGTPVATTVFVDSTGTGVPVDAGYGASMAPLTRTLENPTSSSVTYGVGVASYAMVGMYGGGTASALSGTTSRSSLTPLNEQQAGILKARQDRLKSVGQAQAK